MQSPLLKASNNLSRSISKKFLPHTDLNAVSRVVTFTKIKSLVNLPKTNLQCKLLIPVGVQLLMNGAGSLFSLANLYRHIGI